MPVNVLSLQLRLWFSGRTRPCQGRDGSSILPTRTPNQSGARFGVGQNRILFWFYPPRIKVKEILFTWCSK